MKLLCLHGFAQNGPLFAAKALGLRKALKKAGVETVFLNGAVGLTPADLPFEALLVGGDSSGKDYRAWWTLGDEYDMEPALAAVKQCVEEQGPFDGVMGFSQGAGFAAAVVKRMAEWGHAPRCALFYSGFRLKPEAYQWVYPVTVPLLHVIGELDTVVSEERSMGLVEACEAGTATVLKHPGGHFVPNTKPLINQVVGFVMSHFKEEQGVEPAVDKPAADKPAADKLAADKLAADISKDLLDAIDSLGKL